MLDCGMADERIAGGQSSRVGGTDEEGMTVGGITDLLPCEPCCDAAEGKVGESTIIENGNVDGFPVTKPVDDEAGADNGCRSYT
jgi:hypothetical protein